MNVNQPLFSVLIANHNNGKYLQEAIDSVLAQTYSNWEIVLVDDKSTDNSFEVYDKFKGDSRFHIFFNDENKGCGYTKRRCADMAKGELCGFLDSDDILLPEALSMHVEMHLKHAEESCVFSRYYQCNEKLETIGALRLLQIPQGSSYFENRDYYPEHFASFKRDCYLRTDGIDAELPAAVDQDLYFKLEEVAPVCVLDGFTYKYRIGQCQVSQGEQWIKAFYWNLIVRQNTCKRRHLPPEEYPMRDLSEVIVGLVKDKEVAQSELERTRSSKAFRCGKAILRPFSWLKNKKE